MQNYAYKTGVRNLKTIHYMKFIACKHTMKNTCMDQMLLTQTDTAKDFSKNLKFVYHTAHST